QSHRKASLFIELGFSGVTPKLGVILLDDHQSDKIFLPGMPPAGLRNRRPRLWTSRQPWSPIGSLRRRSGGFSSFHRDRMRDRVARVEQNYGSPALTPIQSSRR